MERKCVYVESVFVESIYNLCTVVALDDNYRDMFLYDDDPVFFDLSVTTFAGVDPWDIDYPDFLISLVGFDVFVDGSGAFETIVYHFDRHVLWGDRFALFTFHPEYTGLCGEPATQRILVRSHVGNSA